MASLSSNTIPFQFRNPRTAFRIRASPHVIVLSNLASSPDDSSKSTLRISADSAPKARFVARRTESVSVRQLQRPLIEYMSLPASQYSVLDAERIERVDDNTFRCYVYRFKFFAFEVCPVLLVRVEEQPNGCCIKLLSCKLEGSPIVVAQNDKFDAKNDGVTLLCQRCCKSFSTEPVLRVPHSNLEHSTHLMFTELYRTATHYQHLHAKIQASLASLCPTNAQLRTVSPLTLIWYGHAASMENMISCDSTRDNSPVQKLTSDAVIEVNIEIPFAFRAIPASAIESTGSQVLEQILKAMLPRFMSQLVKDYQAWASGDTSRQPLGTGYTFESWSRKEACGSEFDA
ncbi:hypothetical protein DH2020_028309 [Rehmannia glutinosa]|uniref:C2H2-type domain-containing protein n=1 Tax=Rehmannia glutinosa TaxID=99300 RepID=A0ABR0VRR7_REHGL